MVSYCIRLCFTPNQQSFSEISSLDLNHESQTADRVDAFGIRDDEYVTPFRYQEAQ